MPELDLSGMFKTIEQRRRMIEKLEVQPPQLKAKKMPDDLGEYDETMKKRVAKKREAQTAYAPPSAASKVDLLESEVRHIERQFMNTVEARNRLIVVSVVSIVMASALAVLKVVWDGSITLEVLPFVGFVYILYRLDSDSLRQNREREEALREQLIYLEERAAGRSPDSDEQTTGGDR